MCAIQGLADNEEKQIIKISQDEKVKLKYLALLENEDVIATFAKHSTDDPYILGTELKTLSQSYSMSQINAMKVRIL